MISWPFVFWKMPILWLAGVAMTLPSGGCCCARKYWRDPAVPRLDATSISAWRGPAAGIGDASAGQIDVLRQDLAAGRDAQSALRLAEIYCGWASQADRAGLPAVDLYYLAVGYSWVAAELSAECPVTLCQAREIYEASLARMLVGARHDGRFVPAEGLRVQTGDAEVCVPLAVHGFPWDLHDFQEVHPVGDYATELISRRQTRRGWGVPVVVRRPTPTGRYREESFLLPGQTFAATMILRPEVQRWLAGDVGAAALEAYDPLRVATVDTGGVRTPLAADLSAPFAWTVVDSVDPVNPLLWFLEPDEVAGEGLFFLEPYQPAKTPIVFVHGLVSEPRTWIDMANDLRATPGFNQHFQIWAFRYATGRGFLASAARLRRDLQTAVCTIDPAATDPAARQIVLVGHSMGGLVSKLQVISSGDRLWRSIANRPFEQIVTDPVLRESLASGLFFEPLPSVGRVIFLATPHQGSSWAARPLGRMAACLVRRDSEESLRLQQIIQANPGVFSEQVTRRLPSSVDMLDADSQLLQAIYRSPVSRGVPYHSVIGTGRPMCGEPADGIVSVQSARLPGADSELYVDATHTQVHRRPETVAEVTRILSEHLAARRGRSPMECYRSRAQVAPVGDSISCRGNEIIIVSGAARSSPTAPSTGGWQPRP